MSDLPPPSRGQAARLHDISAQYQTETALAVCIRETETGPDVWLPKAEIEVESRTRSLFDTRPQRGEIVTITAPEWLLTEKGLL
jgi:hypothetical protein